MGVAGNGIGSCCLSGSHRLHDWRRQGILVGEEPGPGREAFVVDADEALGMWAEVPVTFRQLPAGQVPRAVVTETSVYDGRVVEERRLHESRCSLLAAIDMDAVFAGMADLGEQHQLVDEVPVASVPPVGGGAEEGRLGVAEEAFGVEQSDDSVWVLAPPRVGDEQQVEVVLLPFEEWLAGDRAEKGVDALVLGEFCRVLGPCPLVGQRGGAPGFADLLGDGGGDGEVGIVLGEGNVI